MPRLYIYLAHLRHGAVVAHKGSPTAYFFDTSRKTPPNEPSVQKSRITKMENSKPPTKKTENEKVDPAERVVLCNVDDVTLSCDTLIRLTPHTMMLSKTRKATTMRTYERSTTISPHTNNNSLYIVPIIAYAVLAYNKTL